MIYILSMSRRYDDAIEQAKKTLEMDVGWDFARFHLIETYLYKGMYEEALAEEEKYIPYSDRTAEKKASVMQEIAKIRAAYRESGAEGYWRQILEFEKQEHAKGSEFSSAYMAEIYARLGDNDEAIRWLSTAVDEKDSGIDLLKVHPAFDNLRSDPRFAELLRRMGLPL